MRNDEMLVIAQRWLNPDIKTFEAVGSDRDDFFEMCGDCPQTRKAVKVAWAKVSAAIALAKGTVDQFVEANEKEGA